MTTKKRRIYRWHYNATNGQGMADTMAGAVKALEQISGLSLRECIRSVPRDSWGRRGTRTNFYIRIPRRRYGEYVGSIIWVENEEK